MPGKIKFSFPWGYKFIDEKGYMHTMLPNFLVIGAAKSGTTSLYHYLRQHPEIYMSPIKETEFFVFEGETIQFSIPENPPRETVTRFEDYVKLFQGATTETALGEICPAYLYYHDRAAPRIKEYIPESKLIAILRNPVDRAYSQFLHHIRDGYETITDFRGALEAEKDRIADKWSWGWHYARAGFYCRQLQHYYDLFPEDQIIVFLYSDFKNDPTGMLRRLFRHIRVNENFIPDMNTQYNISGVPRITGVNQLLNRSSKIKKFFKKMTPAQSREKVRLWLKNRNLSHPRMNSYTRSRLIERYREDILSLEKLIQRDLSDWLR